MRENLNNKQEKGKILENLIKELKILIPYKITKTTNKIYDQEEFIIEI